MEYLKQAQLSIMLFLAGICATTSLFVVFTKQMQKKQKRALLLMDIGAVVLLIADRNAYIYRGDPGALAWYMVRICNFLVFFLNPVILYGYNMYLDDICGGWEDRGVKRALTMANVTIVLSVLLLVVSQFTGVCYTFDEANRYQRGPGYLFLVLISLLTIVIQICVIVRSRKRFNRKTLVVLLLFSVVPILAAVVQVFLYGLSLINFGLVAMVVVLYVFTLNRLSEQMEDYRRDLLAMTLREERVNTELALATRIQTDMLPNIFPAFPDRSEVDIYASMTPAKEVGGDFYDFFFVDHDHLARVIADVSGKGIPAAMFMMMAKSMLQTQAAAGHSPQEVLETVNRLICENNKEKMFITVWFGILDLDAGTLTAANAGHEYPILKSPGGDYELVKDKHGFVLGGMKGMKYREYTLTLAPGAKLFVYTDGVTEAMNAGKELFGLERTLRALNAAKDAPPDGVLRSVDEAVARFAGGAEQFDDLTMMCVEYRGKAEAKGGGHEGADG